MGDRIQPIVCTGKVRSEEAPNPTIDRSNAMAIPYLGEICTKIEWKLIMYEIMNKCAILEFDEVLKPKYFVGFVERCSVIAEAGKRDNSYCFFLQLEYFVRVCGDVLLHFA